MPDSEGRTTRKLTVQGTPHDKKRSILEHEDAPFVVSTIDHCSSAANGNVLDSYLVADQISITLLLDCPLDGTAARSDVEFADMTMRP
jgi:hypothetical protein